MFLVVFVTLVISIIGLYAQILSIQANKIYHAQYGLMQTMITWHGAAVSLVQPYVVNQTINGPTLANGCQVVQAGNLSVNGTPVRDCKVTGTPILVTNPPSGIPVLPNGYQTPPFTFTTIVYQTTTAPIEDYVITFVYATDDFTPSGNILLPGLNGTSVGYSLNSLGQQLARAAPANIGYGSVALNTGNGNNYLYVNSKSAGAGLTGASFQVPNVIPPNSIALISSAD